MYCLSKKNKPPYSIFNGIRIVSHQTVLSFKAFKINEQTAEIMLSLGTNEKNYCFNYDFITRNTYQLFSQNTTGTFELMATLNNQTLDYLDEGFAVLSEAQRCYKIIADEKDGNLQQSSSNILCIPLRPILLIPSAFSPNGDGINDTWKISYKGIKSANIKIFNRWGEVVYQFSSEKPEWDGKYKGVFVTDGAYFYQIEANGMKVKKIYKSGLVEVVR